MENLRRGYGFSIEAKQYAKDRANGTCEFGNGICPNKNTNRVNHLTGCFEGYLIGMNPKNISDPKQNAVMECKKHEMIHDITEQANIEILLWQRANRKKH